ncbi:MAG: SIMPL domain-containing protein [Bacteroidales bacterium]|nr:SIMPL domain-containing protein [Bacteroidales bacterium]
MKQILLLLTLVFYTLIVKSQDTGREILRFIEVTGSAEIDVEPDEIRLIIGIEEYWKEEFDKNKEFKDYVTKIPIAEIENNLINDLSKAGIPKDRIMIREVGNYWRHRGKEFLISKQLELILKTFKEVDEIIATINNQGIAYMTIGELKNKDIAEFRRQVKTEALKAAMEKAGYMLKSIDKQVGDIISIVELDTENNRWRPQPAASNIVMPAADNSGIDNLRKIRLRYEIKAKFEIQ